jgi:large subunit ribosomal protein L9
MKVILCHDITNVGKQGDIKDVTAGYARNFLLPKSLVMEATPSNLKIWDKRKDKLSKEREKIILEAKGLAEKIEKTALTITVKVGDNGKIFGSVTTAHVSKVLEDSGFTVEKHSILLSAPIKETGTYDFDIRLHPEVLAKAKLWVVEEKSKAKEHEEEIAAE